MTPTLMTRPAGCVSACHNLRPCGPALCVVGSPLTLLDAPHKPVFSDVMQGVTYIFTQEDDGTLYYQTLPDGVPFEVGRVEQAVAEGAAVGRFVILRLDDGSLVYLRRDTERGRYVWLGRMPSLPSFTVTAEKGTAMSVEMESTRFPKALAEIANPVPAEVSRGVWQAWLEAWSQLAANLRAAGRWIEPVRVRLALRLWDGSLLQVSEPVKIAPPVRAARERVQPGLLWDEVKKAFTGTDACTVSAHGYTLSLTLDESIPEVWADIIAGFELWVSREPETLSAGREPKMSFMHDNTANFISFYPAVRTPADIDADADTQPSGLLSFLPLGRESSASILNLGDMEWNSRVEDFLTPMPGVTLAADCILGYGEFLHTASDDCLYTSVRGNPFVLRSFTQGLGSRVRSLRPQRSGGGAFTRQYIYVSTDRGIIALCHKADGEHTNSRPVSQEPLGPGELWCSTPQGVYALTAGGSLLRLTDARAPVIHTLLTDVSAMLWSNTFQELWLCRPGGSLVCCGQGLFTRPERFTPINGVFSPSLASVLRSDGFHTVVSLDTETPSAPGAKYVVDLDLSAGPWLRLLLVDMSGSDIRYRLSTPLSGTIAAGYVEGDVARTLAVRAPLPALPRRTPLPRRLTLSLSGRFSSLSNITFLPI